MASGCCLVASLMLGTPRLVLLFLWIFTDRLAVAFSTWLAGFAGFLVFPWATLVYVLAYAPGRGVSSVGWLLVLLGFLGDVTSYGGGYRSRTVVIRRS